MFRTEIIFFPEFGFLPDFPFLFKRFLISKLFWRQGCFHSSILHLSVCVKSSVSNSGLSFLFLVCLLYQTQVISKFKQLRYYSNHLLQDDSFTSTGLTTLLSSSGILMDSHCLLNGIRVLH